MENAIITREDAIKQGLTRYFTGKPCKRGHVAERRVANHNCAVCCNEKSKRYQQKLRDNSKLTVKGNAKSEQPAREAARQQAIQNGEKTYFHGIPCKRGHVSPRQTSNGMCMECSREKNATEKAKTYKKNHKKQNLERYREIGREYKKKWNKDNPNYFTEYAIKRSAKLKQATPSWVNLSSITLKYKERNAMSKLSGVKHHVDHIIPLQGKNVCGLHVPQNLRVIPAVDNLRKHNKFMQ